MASNAELAALADRASPPPLDLRPMDHQGDAQRRSHSRNPSRDVRADLPLSGRHSRNASRETHEPIGAMQQLLAAGAHHVRQLSRDNYAQILEQPNLRHSREEELPAPQAPNQDERRDIEQGGDAPPEAPPAPEVRIPTSDEPPTRRSLRRRCLTRRPYRSTSASCSCGSTRRGRSSPSSPSSSSTSIATAFCSSPGR